MLRRDAVAVFKPAAVPLYSHVQALHGVFSTPTKSSSSESVASRVMHSFSAPSPSQPTTTATTTRGAATQEHDDDDEEIVRVDAKRGDGHSTMTGVVSDLLLQKQQSNPSSSSGGSSSSQVSTSFASTTAAAGTATANQQQRRVHEVHFPIGAPDWFSSGVVLASTSPAAHTFLLHAASVGAVRREYHAVCHVPPHVAQSVARSRRELREQRKKTAGKFDLNPAIRRYEEWRRLRDRGIGDSWEEQQQHQREMLQNSEVSCPIWMTPLLRAQPDVAAAAAAAASGELIDQGVLRGRVARLSDLSLSPAYRPDIDELFVSKRKKAADQQFAKSVFYNPLNHWTSKRPHPFLKLSETLAPVKATPQLQQLGSAVQVSANFSVEGIDLVDSGSGGSSSSSGNNNTSNVGAKLFLKLSVLGLQSEASIRAALAAAGVPVINDFEYCPEMASRVAEAFKLSMRSSSSSSSSSKNQRSRDGGGGGGNSKRAVHPNGRMLSPHEAFLLSSWSSSSSSSSPFAVPQFFCSKIVYPDPYSTRNLGILHHMVGLKTTKDLVRAAQSRVPTEDTTGHFSCCVAEVGDLPPSLRAVRDIDDEDDAEEAIGGVAASFAANEIETHQIAAAGDTAAEEDEDEDELAAQATSQSDAREQRDVCRYQEEKEEEEEEGDAVVMSSTSLPAPATVSTSSAAAAAAAAATLEQDARELILSRFNAVSDQQHYYHGGGDNSRHSEPPGIHRRVRRDNQQHRQVRCRYCHGAHHVSQCHKLSANRRKQNQMGES